MKKYEIEISGHTRVEVEADSYNEARQIVKDLIKKGVYDEAVTEDLRVGSGVCISDDEDE
jgi:hypothetical protein